MLDKIKDFYTSKKNSDGYQITRDCKMSMTVHKKSSPDNAVWSAYTDGAVTVDLIDLAVIASAAVLVMIISGTICLIKRSCR